MSLRPTFYSYCKESVSGEYNIHILKRNEILAEYLNDLKICKFTNWDDFLSLHLFKIKREERNEFEYD